MGIWNILGQNLIDAVDTIIEKNRKNAQNNRLRIVMKRESENIARAYMALGKRYYKELQGRQDADASSRRLCAAVDESGRRLERARSRLIALNRQEQAKPDPVEQPVDPMRDGQEETAAEPFADVEEAQEQGQSPCEPVTDAQKEAADETEQWIPHLPEDDEPERSDAD